MNNDRYEFTDYTVVGSSQTRTALSVSKRFMAGVFAWMFVALAVSAIFALLFAGNASLASSLAEVTEHGRSLKPLGFAVMLAPLIFPFVLFAGFERMSSTTLVGLFVLFAATMGISLSFILLTYTAGSVVTCFATAALMFGVMAVMGYTTDKDLTTFGSLLSMVAVGIFVAALVNWVLHSPALNYIISLVGVAVFTGLTAFHVQKLKRIGAGIEYEGTRTVGAGKLMLLGAVTLYLDFINLFVLLLNLFGVRRND
ncbi:Bax inhibitor-1/YccA family protein [Nemorincola caseinilytica]|uniref:Bax inhibitor-1/YccA family protein n=1 Tax=Nemorincola caseinilytica TaxID=2054315 RepID=A0ABP8NK70_9BACT